MRIAREEIFGPVLSVIEFEGEDEAIAIANDTDYGLAASIYTENVRTAHRMARAIKADVLDRKQEYARVPVLKNLLPAQVLMGNSSFNTGTSISAGLPTYARNRMIAFADALAKN
jgi:hypothetical protein